LLDVLILNLAAAIARCVGEQVGHAARDRGDGGEIEDLAIVHEFIQIPCGLDDAGEGDGGRDGVEFARAAEGDAQAVEGLVEGALDQHMVGRRHGAVDEHTAQIVLPFVVRAAPVHRADGVADLREEAGFPRAEHVDVSHGVLCRYILVHHLERGLGHGVHHIRPPV
jgi:hypothetical protein